MNGVPCRRQCNHCDYTNSLFPGDESIKSRMNHISVLIGTRDVNPEIPTGPASDWARVYHQTGVIRHNVGIPVNADARFVSVFSEATGLTNAAVGCNDSIGVLNIAEVEVYPRGKKLYEL